MMGDVLPPESGRGRRSPAGAAAGSAREAPALLVG